MTRWVFVLVFLAYLFGPSRALPAAEAASQERVVAPIVRPVMGVLSAIYPQVAESDRARWTVRVVCALCTAAAVALTFLTLRRFASLESALLLAISAGFASPLWSWTSRCDMSAALATLVVALLLWLALGRSASAAHLRSGVDRVLAAAAAVLVVAATAWLPAGTLALFDLDTFTAYLVSPGRGLAFFAPICLLAAIAVVGRHGSRPIAWGGAAVVWAVLYQLASRSEPWGPLGFGPTLLSPIVPVLAVMAAGLPGGWIRIGALMSLPALLAHGGAVFKGGHTWDERRAIVQNPEAVWDAADSPFSQLAFGVPRPDPASFAVVNHLISPGDHITAKGHPLQWLVYGWEEPETNGTWASGDESWIVIAAPPGEYVLTLIASAPRRADRPQRVLVERPAEPPVALAFTKNLWEKETLLLPFRAESNLSVLKLRPAHVWMPGRGDVRRCGFFLSALRLDRIGAR